MARLFFALTPPHAIREPLAALDPQLPEVRWIPHTQLHLTLVFLGEIADESAVILALDDLEASAFQLALTGIACFGGQRPHVIYAKPSPQPMLAALQSAIAARLTANGIDYDAKPFHPHITVGRVKSCPLERIQPLLDQHATTDFGHWQVDHFSLFASTLNPEGAIHQERHRWCLT